MDLGLGSSQILCSYLITRSGVSYDTNNGLHMFKDDWKWKGNNFVPVRVGFYKCCASEGRGFTVPSWQGYTFSEWPTPGYPILEAIYLILMWKTGVCYSQVATEPHLYHHIKTIGKNHSVNRSALNWIMIYQHTDPFYVNHEVEQPFKFVSPYFNVSTVCLVYCVICGDVVISNVIKILLW